MVGTEGAAGPSRDSFDHRVQADLQLDDAAGCGRLAGIAGLLQLRAQRLDGGADLGAVFGNQSQFSAIEFETLVQHLAGDPPKSFRRDASDLGKTEIGVAELLMLLDEPLGVDAADAGVLWQNSLQVNPSFSND